MSGAEPTAGGRPPDTAWFHCFAGIAGDMALGSLIDAGADLDEITAILLRLRLPGWELTAVPAVRSGLSSTRAVVTVGHDGTERRYAGRASRPTLRVSLCSWRHHTLRFLPARRLR